MNQEIVSIYTFDLKSADSEQQFIESSAKLDTLLLAIEGFHYRSLTKTESGRWQDIVYWDSEEVLKKVDSMLSNEAFSAFMSFIDEASVQKQLAKLCSSVYPGMEAA